MTPPWIKQARAVQQTEYLRARLREAGLSRRTRLRLEEQLRYWEQQREMLLQYGDPGVGRSRLL